METFDFYSNEIPELLVRLSDTSEMQRLKRVGMNCGCEYSSFERFRGLSPYTRFSHSIGAGLITWHFTRDPAAAAAALLHDIATPVFAHTVDFLNGDYVLQESTERRTASVISGSKAICGILSRHGLKPEDVWDYHRFPIADNDSPKLSSDRLEYTLGNGVNYGFITMNEAENLYTNLTVSANEDGEDELCFADFSCAEHFAFLALECSKVYVSPEDRYAMQRLSELIREAMDTGVILPEDLYGDEPAVISKLTESAALNKKWKDFRSLSIMVSADAFPESARVITAKKRRIDPFAVGKGRVSTWNSTFSAALSAFMSWDFSTPIAGR